jgi:ribosome-associated protein
VSASDRAVELTLAAARAAADLKAEEIIALDVSAQLVLTDVFLIASGTNERQVGAIVDAVEESLHKLGAKPLHVQHAEDRVYYALERLWKDCPVIELPADLHGGPAQGDEAGE